MQQVPDGLEHLLAADVRQVQIVEHVVVADGAVALDETPVHGDDLHLVHAGAPLLEQPIHGGVFVPQWVRLVAPREQSLV